MSFSHANNMRSYSSNGLSPQHSSQFLTSEGDIHCSMYLHLWNDDRITVVLSYIQNRIKSMHIPK